MFSMNEKNAEYQAPNGEWHPVPVGKLFEFYKNGVTLRMKK